MQGAPGGGEPGSRMLVETQALWSRGEEKDLHQETTFSPQLLQHVQLVLPTPTACLPHSWHCDPGPCAGIICIFVFPPLPGWEHFSLGELGHSWHRCVLRVMGSRKKSMG